MEDTKRKVGRPRKYLTDEEREEATRQKKHEYYLRTREIRGVLPGRRRGRPVKYPTDEEKKARKLELQASYRSRDTDEKKRKKSS
jgi:hypothetical protein